MWNVYQQNKWQSQIYRQIIIIIIIIYREIIIIIIIIIIGKLSSLFIGKLLLLLFMGKL